MEKEQYVVVLSQISERLLNYFSKNKVDFRIFEFNHSFDLSDVSFDKINNGAFAWRNCDNFIEGLEWEDQGIKAKTIQEKIFGFDYGRGWRKFKCKAYQTEINKKGTIESFSYIGCNNCKHYLPGTINGRKLVLETVRELYEDEIRGLTRRIDSLTTELEKQESLSSQ